MGLKANRHSGQAHRPSSLFGLANRKISTKIQAGVHNRFRDLDERWKSASTGRRTACPTYFAKRLIQQGGAGGFACRSNGLNQWSASKLNKFPKTVMHPVRIFVEIFRLAKPQTETKVDEGEERRDFDPLAGSELPEGIEEINKFRPLMEDVRYVLLKRYAISAWARRPRSHRPVSGEFSKLYSHRPSVCRHGCGMPETRRLAFRIQIQHSAEAKNADPSHFLSAATRWQSTMRILHLDSGLSMRGGQWQALRLAEGLRQAGHTVTVLSRESSPCLEMARGLGLDAEPLTAGSVRRFSGQADLAHAHDARSHTLAALLSAAPLVVSRRVSFPIRGVISRWKYTRPRHFIAVSNFVKDVLIQSGVGPERISVVYDGVPLLTPSIAGETIIAPASSDAQKGTALAVEAARLAGVPLRLSTDLERDLHGAGLFVYITHSEGLGSGVLLAMSAGVPVVASGVGGIPEIVEHERSGLLVDNAPRQIANAILRLKEDRALACRLAARGRQLVEERFSIPAMVAGTTRVYERVLAC